MPAVSTSQQRFMSLVRATQEGKFKHPSAKLKHTANSMSKQDAHDFAATSHDGLPEHVKHKKTAAVLGDLAAGAGKQAGSLNGSGPFPAVRESKYLMSPIGSTPGFLAGLTAHLPGFLKNIGTHTAAQPHLPAPGPVNRPGWPAGQAAPSAPNPVYRPVWPAGGLLEGLPANMLHGVKAGWHKSADQPHLPTPSHVNSPATPNWLHNLPDLSGFGNHAAAQPHLPAPGPVNRPAPTPAAGGLLEGLPANMLHGVKAGWHKSADQHHVPYGGPIAFQENPGEQVTLGNNAANAEIDASNHPIADALTKHLPHWLSSIGTAGSAAPASTPSTDLNQGQGIPGNKPAETLTGMQADPTIPGKGNGYTHPAFPPPAAAPVPAHTGLHDIMGEIRSHLPSNQNMLLAGGGAAALAGLAYALHRRNKDKDKEAADMTVAANRHKVPSSEFAMPHSAPAGSTHAEAKGKYPIPDARHARAALGFAAMHHGKDSAEYKAVVKKVNALGYGKKAASAPMTNGPATGSGSGGGLGIPNTPAASLGSMAGGMSALKTPGAGARAGSGINALPAIKPAARQPSMII